MTATLGLCVIARDEEENIPRLLASVHGVFDEITVIDTGSIDNTKRLAHAAGAKTLDFKWIDDFSAARNVSFDNATTDYVMWLDCDDVVLPADKEKLLQLKRSLRKNDRVAYLMAYDYARDEHGNCVCKLFRHRIVTRSPELRWTHSIHECMSIPSDYQQVMTDIIVTHMRGAKEVARDEGRNLRMLRAAVEREPENARLQFYLGKELLISGGLEECVSVTEGYLKRKDWHDNRVNAHFFIAQAHMALKDDKKAAEVLLRGIHLDPRWAEFYVLMGEIYYRRQEWQKAAQWYEHALHMKPPSALGTVLPDHYTWVPRDRLCKCYSEMNRLQDANRMNEEALKWRPTDRRLLENREWLRDTLFDRMDERPYRFNLGCGGKPVSSYQRCDLYPGPNVDLVFDQCELPYRTGTVHSIYSEHALEHAPSHYKARTAIKEWARALRHGGRLTLKIPDMELCCEGFLRSEDRETKAGEKFSPKDWYRFTIYGIQKSQGGEPDEGQFHRTGFTKAEIRRLLESEGFEVTSLKNYDGWGTPSIHAEAVQKRQTIKVRWCCGTDVNDPSTRIRRINILKWLSAHGIDSRMSSLYASGSTDVGALLNELRSSDIVIFTRFGEIEKELMDLLSKCGVSTVYDMNEDLDGYPLLRECLDRVSHVAFCSTAMMEKWGNNIHGSVIFDAYEESSHGRGHDYSKPYGTDGKLIVTWAGMGGNAETASFLKPLCEELGMIFRVISEWETSDKKWNRETWLNDLMESDIVVCTQRSIQPCKSANRATQSMSLGLPVLGSPLPSYKEAIRNGETGFICGDRDQWKEALTLLRDDASLRERIGRAAKESVKERYSLDSVGRKWISLFQSLSDENCDPPKADIVIPSWRNLKYLQACVESIRNCTDYPHNLIVSASDDPETLAWLERQPDITRAYSPERRHFSEAVNAGVTLGHERFVCILNDDVIVSKGWLGALMREAVKPNVAAVGPLSNCDYGWLHDISLEAGGVKLVPNMTLEQVENVIPDIYELAQPKEIHERDWLPFYCTVLPRYAVNRVGPLDEGFKSGDEDLDYCKRIKDSFPAFRFVQTYDSVVFHAGGKTRKRSEDSDPDRHRREDKENHEHYLDKWGSFPGRKKQTEKFVDGKPLFVMYTGPAWERWNPQSINEGGIGGSETATVYTARAFSKKGYSSIVFSDCDGSEGIYDGVRYCDYRKFQDFVRKYDMEIFVSSRRPEVFTLPIQAEHKIALAHDIFFGHDRDLSPIMDKIDLFFALSPWHKKFMSDYHGIPEDRIHVTRDGVDLSRFTDSPPRVKGRMIYSSSPDRGLDVLLEMLPRIRKEVPELELHVYYGFSTWKKAASIRKNPKELAWIESIEAALKQPSVVYYNRVGQKALAQAMLKSELWAYSTAFTETWCCTAAEVMAAGVPVITTDLAALSTTVGAAGVLIHGDNRSKEYQDRFVEECIRMLTDRSRWEDYSMRGREKAKSYAWDTIADEWVTILKGVEVLTT